MQRLSRDVRFHRLPFSKRGALLLLFCVASLSAAPVEIRFSGTVGGTSFLIPPALQSMVGPGSPVMGRFAYDDEAKDTDPSATRGLYVYRDPAYRLEVQLGQVYVATHPQNPELYIQILNDFVTDTAPQGIDQFDVISQYQTALLPSAVVPGQLQIQLSGLGRTVFTSDALPQTLPSLNVSTPAGQPYAQGQVATLTNQFPGVLINFSIDQWERVMEVVEPRRSVLDERRQAKIIWSDPVDGMALGIIPPEAPFIFIPRRTSDPVDADATNSRAAKAASKGRWHSRALLQVYLKNVSDQPLSWSRDPRLWEVTFGADVGPDPNDANDVAHLQPQGRWYRLEPGRQAQITLPVARARQRWTQVPAGDHATCVHYLARRYQSQKTSRRIAEGTSRFWSGMLQAPAVTIEVKHPARRSEQRDADDSSLRPKIGR